MKNPFLKIVSLFVIFINSTLVFGINPLLPSKNLELNSAKLFNKIVPLYKIEIIWLLYFFTIIC